MPWVMKRPAAREKISGLNEPGMELQVLMNVPN